MVNEIVNQIANEIVGQIENENENENEKIKVIGYKNLITDELKFDIMLFTPPAGIIESDDEEAILDYIANIKNEKKMSLLDVIKIDYPEYEIGDGQEFPKVKFLYMGLGEINIDELLLNIIGNDDDEEFEDDEEYEDDEEFEDEDDESDEEFDDLV